MENWTWFCWKNLCNKIIKFIDNHGGMNADDRKMVTSLNNNLYFSMLLIIAPLEKFLKRITKHHMIVST